MSGTTDYRELAWAQLMGTPATDNWGEPEEVSGR